MNKANVVAALINQIVQMRRKHQSDPEIKRNLINEGWALGAVTKAFDTVS